MGDGIFMIREPGHVQCFLVCGRKKAVLIDTGMGFSDIRPVVGQLTDLPVRVVNTHWHFDHTGGNAGFGDTGISGDDAALITRPLSNALLSALYLAPCQQSGVPFPKAFDPSAYRISNPAPARLLSDNDVLDLGGRTLAVVAAPGHTAGSLCFLDSLTGALFCGDLVYRGTLYAHFHDSDIFAYKDSLARLCRVRDRISRLYVCHNDPVLSPEFLETCHGFLDEVIRGRVRSTRDTDWGEPVLRYESGPLALLAPCPDSPGIDLLACRL